MDTADALLGVTLRSAGPSKVVSERAAVNA
jgi:hypothetical protein